MFPQFVSTAASFSRATALLTRVGTDAQFYDDPETENFSLLLDSKFEAEKTEGMKRLIALMSQGRDVSNYFPQVVKNVVTQSLELKKLVYIYLVHYAQKRPDEALLAINTFQKDLSDLNPLVRAWALRAMSGIQVRVVLPLVVMGVNKCARDPSPYVRRCAAHAISKIYSLDREQHVDALEELICLLMNDNAPSVIGAVAAAFTVVCPEKLFIWGEQYQKFCSLLPEIDEWGQVVLMDILLRYAVGRWGYPEGSIGNSSVGDDGLGKIDSQQELVTGRMQLETSLVTDAQLHIKSAQKKKMGMENTSSLPAIGRDLGFQGSTDFWLADATDGRHNKIQLDIELLLQSTLPLFWSHNSAVVMAAAGVHWVLASKEDLKKIVEPVLFLLRSSFESQYVVLANIATFVSQAPSLFEPYYEEFFILSTDTEHIREMKLDILCRLATESSIGHILEEFQVYVRDRDRQFASNTVRAIGQCALRLQTVAKSCTEALLLLARRGSSPPHDNVSGAEKEDQEVSRQERISRPAVAKSRYKTSEGHEFGRESLVVTEAVSALRIIIHKHPVDNEEILVQLFRGLDHLKIPAARAIVISMVGEFCTGGTRLTQMVPAILQYLGGSFKQEKDEAKLQILNCAAKVVLRSGTLSKPSSSRTPLLILDYVLRLAAQDLSYDIRDRARMYQQLLAFHLQNLSTAGKSGNGKDLADRFLNLNFQEANIDLDRIDKADEQKASCRIPPGSDDGKNGAQDMKVVLLKLAERIILVPKPVPMTPLLSPDRSAFVSGSMSHIVLHRAPNYNPLPTPFSIELVAPSSPVKTLRFEKANVGLQSSSNGEYSGTVSEEGNSDHISSPRSSGNGHFYQEDGEISIDTPVSSSEDTQFRSNRHSQKLGRNKPETHPSSPRSSHQRTQGNRAPPRELGPLINLSDSDAEPHAETQKSGLEWSNGKGSAAEFGLLSEAELDSWLGSSEPSRAEQLSLTEPLSGYATISIGHVIVNPTIHTLLDLTKGAGLDVKYRFERMDPMGTGSTLRIMLFVENRSLETLSDIGVTFLEFGENDHEVGSACMTTPCTDLQVDVSGQELIKLEPGDTAEKEISVHVLDHPRPISLCILCSGKSFLVKLIPNMGSLMRPTLLRPEAFSSMESQITGMHEAHRRCALVVPAQSEGSSGEEDQILVVARVIAQRVLSTAHVSLVSTIMPISDSVLGIQSIKSGGLQGLSLQFSGETLTGCVLCLIIVTALTEIVLGRDGAQVEVLVKVKSEDTVFGLSLLQELSKALNSSD